MSRRARFDIVGDDVRSLKASVQMLTWQGMLRVFLIACVTLNLIACGSLAVAEQTLYYVDLVSRLTDLERLAEIPEAGEQCA